MRTLTRLCSISLLALAMTACDGNTTTDTTSKSTIESSVEQNISLLNGKLSFTLPAGLTDQSDKLVNASSNKYIYADSKLEHSVIVILESPSGESLSVLAQRMEEQQKTNDANLQVISNKAVTSHGQNLQRIDTIQTRNGNKVYVAVVLGQVADHMLTMQITVPADNQQQAQTMVDTLVNTLKLGGN